VDEETKHATGQATEVGREAQDGKVMNSRTPSTPVLFPEKGFIFLLNSDTGMWLGWPGNISRGGHFGTDSLRASMYFPLLITMVS
jgi:hypothetical protein